MTSRLRSRVDAMWKAAGGDSDEVLAALDVLRRTGTAPPGHAGERAVALWKESAGFSNNDSGRAFWCTLQVTGMTVAELFARASRGRANTAGVRLLGDTSKQGAPVSVRIRRR